MKKLHLGCGNKKIDGYTNIDIRESVNPDIVDDISKLITIENSSVDLIYACHVLEHFGRHEYIDVIKRWHEVLRSDGILRISVPDIRMVAELIYKKEYPLKKLLGFIYGGQNHTFNYHYVGFDFDSLREDLIEIGFKDIKFWNWNDVEHKNVDDFSQAYLPHMQKENGVLMSLNIECKKI